MRAWTLVALLAGAGCVPGRRATTELPPAVRAALASVPPPQAVPAAPAPEERPLLLWRLERDGGVSHVLGTCLGESELPDLPLELHAELFRDAWAVGTELFLDREAVLAAADGVFRETRLAGRIGTDHFRPLAAAAPGVPASLLDRLAPWAAVDLGLLAYASGDPTASRPFGAQARLFRQSREARRRTFGLETPSQRVAAYRARDQEYYALLAAGRAPLELDPEARAACRSADPARVAAVATRYSEGDRAERARRVAAYTPRLLSELRAGGVLLAVEAHVAVGPDGLLERLQREGYSVVPVSTTEPSRPPRAPSPRVLAQLDAEGTRTIGVLADVYADRACTQGDPLAPSRPPPRATCLPAARRDLELCAWQALDVGIERDFDDLVACASLGHLTETSVRLGELPRADRDAFDAEFGAPPDW